MPFSALVNPAQLGRELKDLAGRPQLAGRRDELQSLGEDLEAARNLDAWSGIDLVAAFARPESLADPAPGSRGGGRGGGRGGRSLWARISRIVREEPLEAALGVMVFAPLLVTWFGLRMASRAYGELAKDNPKEASRPFLQLWQSGFDGHLSSYERFDSLALVAVGLIGVLLLLALAHALLRTRNEREAAEREAEGAVLLSQLASVLTRAQLALVAHRNSSPARFAAELTGAARQLRSLTNQAVKSHDKLVLVADATDRAATELGAATDRLSKEVPQLGSAADRIETAVRAGSDALRDAQAKAVDAVRAAQDTTVRTGEDNATAVREVGERIGRAGAVVDTALKELAAVQQQLVVMSEQAVQAADRASQNMVRSADRTGDAVDGMRKATEQWDAVAAHWQDAAARLDAGIRLLAGAPQPEDAVSGSGLGAGLGAGG
ncbi:hypothetical protein ACFO3J_15180 [Streptomyces polygonati]|uniref:Methyl-accepting chemotaxis protein n=1 Tax=Streptomyces polygonati TaxID=1617087 RepID=A0ABV8HPI7_9ACTN